VVDRIAICSAGLDAQELLGAPTNDIAGFSDVVKIKNILVDHLGDEDGAEAEALRSAGFRKSQEMVELHRYQIVRLAAALAQHSELDQATVDAVLADGE
jgi:hypothetical protein